MKKLIIFIVLFVASCGKGTTIHYHGGGTMAYALQEISDMEAPRRIKGTCASYCNYAFSTKYKDTCVYPRAEIMFHAVFWRGGIINRSGTIALANQFNDRMRDWYLKTVFDSQDHWLTGMQVHNMFNIPVCK